MQFAQAMAQLKPEMSPDEVRRILGEPDDIVTDADLPPNQWSAPFVSWKYGTSGHDTFPMLGTVTFEDEKVRTLPDYFDSDEDGEVQRPPQLPPPEDLISESELRHLLEKIHAAVSGFESFAPYDSLRIIQAVNALQSAGTAKAIASIKEYVRIRSGEWGWDNVFGIECLLKAAFDTGGAIANPPGLWTNVDDLITAPQHPLLIIDDIPFLIQRPGGTTGEPMPPHYIVYFFEKFGQVRPNPLVPTNHPIEALQKLIEFELADGQEPTSEDVNNVREKYLPQIRILIRSAIPLPLDEDGKPLAWVYDCDGVEAPRVQQEIEQFDLRWDSEKQYYTRADGMQFSEGPPLNRARIFWEPTSLAKLKGKLTLKRSSPAHAWVLLEWEYGDDPDEAQFIVQFSASNSPQVSFQIPRARPPKKAADKFDDLCGHITVLSDRVGSISESNGDPSAYLQLPDRHSIRADVFTEDGRLLESREFTP